ncbi:MAG: fibrobacter succinogenes major paralogous domain-containing protein [Bacteroidota bacterium]
MRSFPVNSYVYALWGMFLLLFFSCEKENGDGIVDWPANFEEVTADYVGPDQVFVTADIAGTFADIGEMGFCWATTSPPTVDDNKLSHTPIPGIYTHTIEGLESGTTYFARAYYLFEDTAFYSTTLTFTTTTPVEDNDGNAYKVIQIGNRLWMGENLRVSSYNNDDPISDGTGTGNYSGMEDPKFFFHYDDDPDNDDDYGKLYTWHVITDNRGICPAQWRVPDIADWEQLIGHLDALSEDYLSPDEGSLELSAIAGGMLRQTGTLEDQTGLWHSPNTGASNITGMNLVPSGLRDPSGSFDGMGYNAAFWSFTEETSNSAIMMYTHYFNPGIYANHFVKSSGYAVRCVRNAP